MSSACELCGGPGVRLSTGLEICGRCFWGNKLTSHFLNKRFGSGIPGQRKGGNSW